MEIGTTGTKAIIIFVVLLIAFFTYLLNAARTRELELQTKVKALSERLNEELNDNIELTTEIVHARALRIDALERLQIVHNASHEVFKLNERLVKTGSLLEVKLPIGVNKAEILEAFATPSAFEEYIEVDNVAGTANLAIIKYSDLMNWFNELVEANLHYMQSFKVNDKQ